MMILKDYSNKPTKPTKPIKGRTKTKNNQMNENHNKVFDELIKEIKTLTSILKSKRTINPMILTINPQKINIIK